MSCNMVFSKLIKEVGEWSRHNFGSQKGAGALAPLAGIVEEIGELLAIGVGHPVVGVVAFAQGVGLAALLGDAPLLGLAIGVRRLVGVLVGAAVAHHTHPWRRCCQRCHTM